MSSKIKDRKQRRKKRVSSGIKGTTKKPRVSVYRSNNHIYAQFIDDENGHTLISFSDDKLKKSDVKKNPIERAKLVGVELAKQAKDREIKEAVFDRGSYKYHGRVKAVAEGLREGGLEI